MEAHDRHKFSSFSLLTGEIGQTIPSWLNKLGDRFDQGVVIFDQNFRILFCNRPFLEHTHLTEDTTRDSRQFDQWLAIMAKRGDLGLESPAAGLKNIFEAMRSKADRFELHNISPPNGRFLEFKSITSESGVTTLFSDDVTELRRQKEALDLALETGKSGYFVHSFDNNETKLSSQYLSQILTKEEYQTFKTQGFWPLFDKKTEISAREIWKDSVLKKNEVTHTLAFESKKAGEIILSFSVRPIMNNGGKVVRLIGFFKDVTETFRANEAIESERQKTEEALQSKTHFLARISHEIRTPMNAVIGIADALIHHNKNPDIIPKLELIQNSAGNILNILDDTLSHSKLDTHEFELDPQKDDLSKTIRQICNLWQSKAAENNARISCHIDESVPPQLFFDRYRYEQCLNNLLSNAIKFSPGGKIDVIATRVDRNGEPFMLVAVKDTGIGMTEDQKARIFTAYQQGDDSISRRFGGTGLGMNITKNLIERMGGTISVKSQIGEGSVFILSLPILTDKDMKKAVSQEIFDEIMTASELEKDTPYAHLKVLVADDNPTNHMVVKSLLDGIVSEVYTADHGRDVLDILETQHIDIVLMDIHMPVMDGIEATLAIRSSPHKWSDVMIIAVTADPQYQQQRLCINIGMDFAVAKPVKLVDLLEAIDQVMAIKNGQLSFSKTA